MLNNTAGRGPSGGLRGGDLSPVEGITGGICRHPRGLEGGFCRRLRGYAFFYSNVARAVKNGGFKGIGF